MCLRGEAIKPNVKISLIKTTKASREDLTRPIAPKKKSLFFYLETDRHVQQGALSTHKWSLWCRTGSILAGDPLSLVTFSRDKNPSLHAENEYIQKKSFKVSSDLELTVMGKGDLKGRKRRQQQCQINPNAATTRLFPTSITAGQVKVSKPQIKKPLESNPD